MPLQRRLSPVFRSWRLIASILIVIGGHAWDAFAATEPVSIRVVLDDNYPPYSFRDANGSLQGVAKSRWALWEARTGIKVDLQGMDWGRAQETMQAGRADVIDTIFKTPEREQRYSFSAPYATLDVALVFDRSISGITDARTARGFQVAVKNGDACADHLRQHGVTDLQRYPSYQAMIDAAVDGRAKVMCIDTPPARYLLTQKRIDEQFRRSTPLFSGQFHWAVRKSDDQLKATIEHGFSLISAAELAQVDTEWLGASLGGAPWDERLRYGLYALLAFGCLSAILAAWTALLRRQVATKTQDLSAALEELRASQMKFKALFERATDAIVLLDSEKCIDCNERAAELYRVPREALIGAAHLDFSPLFQPDGRSSAEHLAEQLTKVINGEVAVFEWQNVLGDGTHLDVEVSWSQLTIADKIYQQAVVRDIGARKQVEAELDRHRHHLQELVDERTAELAASEQRFKGLADQSLVGIDIIQDGRFYYVNQAFADIFGYASAEQLMAEASVESLVAPEDRARVREAIRSRATGETETAQYEAMGQRKDGSPVAIEIYGRRIQLQGRPATIGMVLDISRRRALDEARELALQEAERLARMRSEFLANMSHEIRTPLNGVLGLARMGYRRMPDNSEARGIFAKIVSSGMLLLGVVNDILDFSKIEAGRMSLESVVIELDTLLAESLNLIQESAATKGIRLHFHKAPSLPAQCLGDPLRIQQILLNLLSNAVKFTEQGSVSLEAGMQCGMLTLAVEDTGIGIAAEDVPTLFRPFRQGDPSTTRRFGGTGLGLTICKRLVDLMGGEIQVTSRANQGSRFEVHLPFVPTGNTSAIDKPPTYGTGATHLQGIRILVAEDNEVNQLVIREILTAEQAELTIVDNGQAAVEQIALHGANHFAAVMLDIQMPIMDGYDAARHIHALAPMLPIIGQTAHALAEDRLRCLEAGMVDHIAKPFDPDALVNILLQHIGHTTADANTGQA